MSSAATQPPPPQSPSCLMLPYGYQIDLDFIKYCENVTQLDPSDAEFQRRQRRRQRQSMEVMLGIQMEMQQQMDQLSEIWERQPPEPPPRTHHHMIESPITPFYIRHHQTTEEVTKWDPSLNDVVDAFEKTLEKSKKGKERNNRRERSRDREPDGKQHFYKKALRNIDLLKLLKLSLKSSYHEYNFDDTERHKTP